MKLPQLAFEISREIGEFLRGRKLLIACSGGVDSMTLVDVLTKLSPRFDLKLAVAHIHHGPGSPDRDVARNFVIEESRRRWLQVFVRESAEALKSEDDFRQFRMRSLNEIVAENGFDRVVIAHHADDLLETRLMRLIRGTGPQGLRAMKPISPKAVRPFLGKSRAEILEYARKQNLKWIEDSSNSDSKFFRNWVRNEWLQLLEKRQPGSCESLARSLDLLSALAPAAEKAAPKFGRKSFAQMNPSNKKELLLAVANSLSARDFGHSKIIEVLKRLDRLEVSCQRRASFQVGGVEWTITPDNIEATRRLSANAGPRS